ncbi:hypothetical protein FACS189483_04120 [Spirochaetia bacterium]|nr:hypothetical protein FACS189483_04120 [Spirochaetia bacterium]
MKKEWGYKIIFILEILVCIFGCSKREPLANNTDEPVIPDQAENVDNHTYEPVIPDPVENLDTYRYWDVDPVQVENLDNYIYEHVDSVRDNNGEGPALVRKIFSLNQDIFVGDYGWIDLYGDGRKEEFCATFTQPDGTGERSLFHVIVTKRG